MKRARDELEETAIAIVEKAHTRDAKHNLVYQDLWQNPVVVSMMQTPDALLEALRDRPILFLRLLETNKALNTFWTQFTGVWRLLIERLVAMELNVYMSQVYAFFIVENERFIERGDYAHTTLNFIGPHRYAFSRDGEILVRPELGLGTELFVTNTVLAGDATQQYYYYVAYDAYTRRFVTLLQHLFRFTAEKTHRGALRHILAEYLGITPYRHFVVCYRDGFLTTSALIDPTELVVNTPHIDDVRPLLELVEVIARNFRIERDRNDASRLRVFKTQPHQQLVTTIHTNEHIDIEAELADLRALAHTLDKEPFKALRLDATSIRPWHTQLYTTLYPTPEEQKILFLRLLRTFLRAQHSYLEDDPEKVAKYSESYTLQCVYCQKTTALVDPTLNLAFCRVACRDSFTQ